MEWFKEHKVITAILAIVGIFVVAGAIAESTDTGNGEETAEPAAAEEEPTPTPQEERESLGLTTEDFRSRWNAAAEDVGVSEFTIGSLDVDEGDVQDVWQHRIQANIFIQGAVNKRTGEINEITVIGNPENDRTSTDILLTWGTLIATLSPELDPDGRGQIFRDLRVIDGADDFSDLDERTVRGEVEYHIMGAPELGGMIFVASPS